MSIVYLLQNQHNQYLSKAGEWLEGDAASALYRTEHKDEAINRKVEFTVKNVELRIVIVKASLRENGTPELSNTPKNEQAEPPTGNNNGPLFNSDATDDTPPEQPSEQNPSIESAVDSAVVTDRADATQNLEDNAIDNTNAPLASTDKPAEQKSEEDIYTAVSQAEPENDQGQNTESTAPNTDEVREAI